MQALSLSLFLLAYVDLTQSQALTLASLSQSTTSIQKLIHKFPAPPMPGSICHCQPPAKPPEGLCQYRPLSKQPELSCHCCHHPPVAFCYLCHPLPVKSYEEFHCLRHHSPGEFFSWQSVMVRVSGRTPHVPVVPPWGGAAAPPCHHLTCG